jgi:hypothetical protein
VTCGVVRKVGGFPLPVVRRARVRWWSGGGGP